MRSGIDIAGGSDTATWEELVVVGFPGSDQSKSSPNRVICNPLTNTQLSGKSLSEFVSDGRIPQAQCNAHRVFSLGDPGVMAVTVAFRQETAFGLATASFPAASPDSAGAHEKGREEGRE